MINSTVKSELRKPGPIRAALLNFIGLGLGYVYVGRIKLAFAFIAATIVFIAVVGWSGLVFNPIALYGFAAIAICASLAVIIHCTVIAVRNQEVKPRPYNVWWFYLVWIAGSYLLSNGIIWSRSVLFGFEPFTLPSSSMVPTLNQGDYIMTNTWYYDQAEPKYGDLVVFNVSGSPGTRFIKRIIGLPGDQIEIRDDVLVRNGQVITEPYIQLTDQPSGLSSNYGPETVPNTSIFVLGDNRHRSRDSRYIGPIDKSMLHGRVIHRWFAFDESIQWDQFPQRLDINSK